MQDAIGFHGEAFHFDVRVLFQAEDKALLDAACGLYTARSIAWPDDGPAIRVKLAWRGNAVEPPLERRNQTAGHRMHIVQDDNVLRADGMAGTGECLISRRPPSRHQFADLVHTVVCFLVAHAGRIPLHASVIVLENTALVLAGKSGSGKSSLALAAHRMGLPVLSEDTVYVQTEPRFRVWGAPKAIHVFEKDAPGDEDCAMRLRGGRWKRAIAIQTPRSVAERAMLFVLAYGARAELRPLETGAAIAALTRTPEPGYEFYGSRSAVAIRALCAGGCYRLVLSGDPGEALGVLLDRFGRTACERISA